MDLSKMASVFEAAAALLETAEQQDSGENFSYYLAYASRKAMIILLERAVLSNAINSVCKIPATDIPHFNIGNWHSASEDLATYCENLFHNILYAYGWKCSEACLDGMDIGISEESTEEDLKEHFLAEGIRPSLVNALAEQGVLTDLFTIYLEESYIIFWENPAFSAVKSQILSRKEINPAVIGVIEHFESKFLHMKRHCNILAPPLMCHDSLVFYYLYEYVSDNMGSSFYSDAFYLQMHIPIYAALADEYIRSL